MPRQRPNVQSQPVYEARQRLFVTERLVAGANISLTGNQAHYLRNVLRCQTGDAVLLFNGADGEWQAQIEALGKKQAELVIGTQHRPQSAGSDLWLLVAPVKRDRLDYLAQKATEMGVSRLVPVITRRTQGGTLKLDRLRANAIEAAEQCGILNVPDIAAPQRLEDILHDWPADRVLVFCDETAPSGAGLAGPGLADIEDNIQTGLAVLVGPEGGFDASEHAMLNAHAQMRRLSLGPRILRTDTAVVAALAVLQARFGDWR
ncbi:MAG: 16S rRNA (uracil(1498)-N(3))-methyltransferase [Parvibaculales bacterium]